MKATATPFDLAFEKRVYDALWPHVHNAGNLWNMKKIVRALHAKKALPPLLQAMTSKSIVKAAQTLFQASVFQSKKTADTRFAALRQTESTSAPPSAAAALPQASQPSPQLSELPVSVPEPGPGSDEGFGSVDENTASEMETPTGCQDSRESKTQQQAALSCAVFSRKEHELIDTTATANDPLEQTSPGNLLTISYTVQHRLLSEIQRILEEACFYFAKRRQLDILQTMSWDCPEAIELNVFMRKAGLSFVRFDEDGTAHCESYSMSRLIASVSRIRHAAVHRERVTTTALEDMLYDSGDLLYFLGDDRAMGIMDDLHSKVKQGLAELGERERQVDKHVDVEMHKIRTQRAKLDEWERNLTLAAEEQKREMRDGAGVGISAALASSRTDSPAAKNKNCKDSYVYSRGDMTADLPVDSLVLSVPTACWNLVARIWAAAPLSLGYLFSRKASVIQANLEQNGVL